MDCACPPPPPKKSKLIRKSDKHICAGMVLYFTRPCTWQNTLSTLTCLGKGAGKFRGDFSRWYLISQTPEEKKHMFSGRHFSKCFVAVHYCLLLPRMKRVCCLPLLMFSGRSFENGFVAVHYCSSLPRMKRICCLPLTVLVGCGSFPCFHIWLTQSVP